MIAVFAENINPAIRGLLKRWFIEPRPNVFVGSLNCRTREKTIAYIRRNAPGVRLLIVHDDDNSQGFSVLSLGYPTRKPVVKCGLSLISEPEDGGHVPA